MEALAEAPDELDSLDPPNTIARSASFPEAPRGGKRGDL